MSKASHTTPLDVTGPEPAPPVADSSGSYRHILRATSLLGGAAAIQMMVSLVRGKIVALTLGPVGLGVMGAYMSVTGLVTTLAAAGLATSGVREISEALGSKDAARAATAIHTFRWLSFLLAVLGTVALAVGAGYASEVTFGNVEHQWGIALLSLTVGAGILSSYFSALLQAAGRVGKTAKVSVASNVIGAAASVACFLSWGKEGIVPALLAGALVQTACTWWMCRDVTFPQPAKGQKKVNRSMAWRMLTIGSYVVLLGFMLNAVNLLIRTLLIRELGEAAAGMYQSAGGLSMMFATFILGAMGTDFLPRLSAVVDDSAAMNRMVNEQSSVGILLGLPGVLGTILAAPLLMPLLYSHEFSAGVPVLQLLAVGVYARIISWPMSFVLITRKAVFISLLCEVLAHAAHVAVIYYGIHQLGVAITGWGAIASFVVFTLLMRWATGRITGFQWSGSVLKLQWLGGFAIAAALAISMQLSLEWSLAAGSVLLLAVGWYCLQQLGSLSGLNHSGAVDRLLRLFRLKRA